MVQGLLLDWVAGHARIAAKRRENYASAGGLPHETEAALSFSEPTMTRAQIAFDAPVGRGMPPASNGNAGMGKLIWVVRSWVCG